MMHGQRNIKLPFEHVFVTTKQYYQSVADTVITKKTDKNKLLLSTFVNTVTPNVQ